MTLATPEPSVVSSGFRLVPALIGRAESASTVWIECPEWCTLDHATDRQVALEDVWHCGEYADLEMPHRNGTELVTYARLGLDPYSRDDNMRRMFAFLEDGSSVPGCYMDADHLDQFADNLAAFAEKIRAMARSVAK